jgi:hypothetical protein
VSLLRSFSDKALDLIEPRTSNFRVLSMAHTPRKKTLEELKAEAVADLERRGLKVRGKTPAQIRKLLRLRSKKRSSNQTGTRWRTNNRD